MQQTIQGTYRDGRIHLLEEPPSVGESQVLIPFLEPGNEAAQLTREEVAELRGKLASWEEDWNAPGMDVYDEA